MARYILLLCFTITSPVAGSILRAESAGEPVNPGTNLGENREKLIWKCRSCRLTLLDREIIDGKLLKLRPDSLEIEYEVIQTDWDPFTANKKEIYRRTVSFDDIASVRCGDSVWNGVIWGAVITALPTFLITETFSSMDEGDEPVETEWGIVGASTGIAAGIGALLGYLIDRVDGPRYDPDVETLRRVARE